MIEGFGERSSAAEKLDKTTLLHIALKDKDLFAIIPPPTKKERLKMLKSIKKKLSIKLQTDSSKYLAYILSR